MNKRKPNEAFPAVGGSSLLVIFAVLCFTVFAMLALSTVQATRRLSEKNAQAVAEYYAADAAAEAILAELRTGNLPEGVLQKGNRYTYACEISEFRELQVEVLLSGDSYEIQSWNVVYTGDWENRENLEVWDGFSQ